MKGRENRVTRRHRWLERRPDPIKLETSWLELSFRDDRPQPGGRQGSERAAPAQDSAYLKALPFPP